MDQTQRFVIYGNNGSPYSCKIRSYLRFKRFPFNWVTHSSSKWPEKHRHIRPKVIPVVEFPNGFAMNESTNIIQKVEAEFQSNRAVIPANKCLAFIADLLEDMADEWVTKLMFAMRWNRTIDQDFSSLFIMQCIPSNTRKQVANMMKKRQVDRCAVVGCDNDEEMHESFHEICSIFEKYLRSQNEMFIFGSRPTNADFAFFGQMSQFRIDITSDRILREKYVFLFSWLERMDDLSGIEVEKQPFLLDFNGLRGIVSDLLSVCGNVYLPFLRANYMALQHNKQEVSVDLKINGKVINHKQAPFKWQGKCLKVLQSKLNAIRNEKDFDKLQEVLIQTGCWEMLNAAVSKL